MRALVSGFEPFGGERLNPSGEVLGVLPPRVGAADVATVTLPVRFADAWEVLAAAVEEAAPDVVVALGQAAGTSAVTIEEIAVNLDGPEDPDEAGSRPVDEPIVDGAPLAYRTGLPARGLEAALAAQGIPARRSRSAGAHLCNHVFYRLCHLAATARPGLRAGFVHLPCLPAQALDGARPSLPLDLQVEAVRAVLGVALTPPSR